MINEKLSPFSYYASHFMECGCVQNCNVRKVSEISELIGKCNIHLVSTQLLNFLTHAHSVNPVLCWVEC